MNPNMRLSDADFIATPSSSPDTNGLIAGEKIVDHSILYSAALIAGVKVFATQKPWQGTEKERQAKMEEFHAALAMHFQCRSVIEWHSSDATSGGSYVAKTDEGSVLHLIGRISVVTFLQMFAYAAFEGGDGAQVRAVKWSVNLFRHAFPISWKRCHFVGHLVINDGRRDD